MISPAFEKILSEGTEVAGITKYFNAKLNNSPNSILCLIQKSIGFDFLLECGRLKYCFKMLSAVLTDVT